MARFVCTAPIDECGIDILAQHASVEIAPDPAVATMMGLLDDTIGIVCRGEGKVPAEIIETAPDLRVIGRTGAGYDAVDIESATRRGLPVVFAPINAFAVAEGALAMLLSLVKLLPQADGWVKTGQWQKRYECTPGDMTEHTLGIVGFGRIGQGLANLVRVFDMTVLAYDPVVADEIMHQLGAEKVELDDLLARSDYVSIHAPLTDESRGMFNAERISRMKRGAILVNMGRGALIEDLDVLADALHDSRLAGVGLDVFPEEPPDHNHRLFRHSACLCSPHQAGVSDLAWKRICRSMAEDMVTVLGGGRPRYCANPEVFS